MAFLGEATPDTAKKVATALAKVPQTAVCWRFSGLGVFSRQQILWAGLAETDRFNALAEQVRLCLDDMGQHYGPETLSRTYHARSPMAGAAASSVIEPLSQLFFCSLSGLRPALCIRA